MKQDKKIIFAKIGMGVGAGLIMIAFAMFICGFIKMKIENEPLETTASREIAIQLKNYNIKLGGDYVGFDGNMYSLKIAEVGSTDTTKDYIATVYCVGDDLLMYKVPIYCRIKYEFVEGKFNRNGHWKIKDMVFVLIDKN